MAIDLGDGVLTFKGDTTQVQKGFRDLSTVVTGALFAIGAAATKVFVSAVKEAASFESAFAGIRKTVDATEEEFAEMREEILQLSTEIPVAANELAKIGEIAGQLGIKKENIIAFTRTIADLSVSTNIAGESGALMVAQFMNITGTPQEMISNLGSAIVDLGNNTATTEQDILELGTRIAAAGELAGFTEGDILGIAAALASVGVKAAMGGTAISQVIRNMHDDFLAGKDSMEKWADVAGMSAEDFHRQWSEKPAQALAAFIKGLERLKEEGGSVTAKVEELGLEGIRLADVMGRATLAADLFQDAIVRGNTAFTENTALQIEAAKRYETFDSKLQMFKNTWAALKIVIGDELLPELSKFLVWAKDALLGVIEFTKAHKELIPFVAKLTVAITALTGIKLGVKMIAWTLGLTKMGGAIGGTGALTAGGGATGGLIGAVAKLAIGLKVGLMGAVALVTSSLAATVIVIGAGVVALGLMAKATYDLVVEKKKLGEAEDRNARLLDEYNKKYGLHAKTLEEQRVLMQKMADERWKATDEEIKGIEKVEATEEKQAWNRKLRTGEQIVRVHTETGETIDHYRMLTAAQIAAHEKEMEGINKTLEARRTAATAKVSIEDQYLTVMAAQGKTADDVLKTLEEAHRRGTETIAVEWDKKGVDIEKTLTRLREAMGTVSPYAERSPSLVEQTISGLSVMAEAWHGFASWLDGLLGGLWNKLMQLGGAMAGFFGGGGGGGPVIQGHTGGEITKAGIIDVQRDERIFLPQAAQIQRAGAGGIGGGTTLIVQVAELHVREEADVELVSENLYDRINRELTGSGLQPGLA